MAAPHMEEEFYLFFEKLDELITAKSNDDDSTKENLRNILQNLTASSRLDKNRAICRSKDHELIYSIVRRHLSALHQKDLTAQVVVDLELVCECFRLLRNVCAGSPANQLIVNQHPLLVRDLQSLIQNCLRITDHEQCSEEDQLHHTIRTLLRCALQFVGNCVSGCPDNVDLFWTSLLPAFGELLSSADKILRNYTCMVIYNCLTPSHTDQLLDMVIDGTGAGLCSQSVVGLILNHLEMEGNEWSLYVVQKILATEKVLGKTWATLNDKERKHLLDVICVGIQSVATETKEPAAVAAGEEVHGTNIDYVADLFVLYVETLLQPEVSSSTDLAPHLICGMIDCLCATASVTRLLSRLQKNMQLLKSSVGLLSAVHKASSAAIGKISSSDSDNESVSCDSVFGLKRDLVRLLGNLVYRSRANQDLVRDLDGIPLILDQTKIDDSNPFISQWAVFAVRNLCEDNLENQQVVTDLKMQGLADNVASLQELGVKAELDGHKIVVRSDDD